MAVNFNDPDFVLMCALDWVIGRSTYAPNMLTDEIIHVWDDLKPETKKYIKTRIMSNKLDKNNSSLKKILDLWQ